MKKNNIVILVIVAVLVLAGTFYGGMKYGQGSKASVGQAANGANGRFAGQGARRGGGAGGGFTNGEIIKADNTSITIKLQDGGSKIIFVSDSTAISKQAAGSKSDLQVGQNVMVTGTSNADGTLSAAMVQLRPAGAPGANGGNAPSATSTDSGAGKRMGRQGQSAN
ncbi:MAG: DUF5666 domain-containing protein [Candidatus Falkowbacteria bacterium]